MNIIKYPRWEIRNNDRKYPEILRQIRDKPERIYGVGRGDLLKEKMVAVVGSRNISRYGEYAVKEIIPELVRKKVVIVSGMAFGVDALVHLTCIKEGGKTIAVLASGADRPSPRSNYWIYERILESGGLIISENSFGYEPRKEDFLKRNRIMAGLVIGVLVIEGDKRSGSLVTAKLALEYGKDVWAVPGRINDLNSWAPNYLIKNGAGVITEKNDFDFTGEEPAQD